MQQKVGMVNLALALPWLLSDAMEGRNIQPERHTVLGHARFRASFRNGTEGMQTSNKRRQ
jgi:hypothetical protein